MVGLAPASDRARRAINWGVRKLPLRVRVWLHEHAEKHRERRQAREEAKSDSQGRQS